MELYRKTITPKNTFGKIAALLCLLCGAALFILSNGSLIPFPAIAQISGLLLLTAAIYIASVYLLKQFTFMVVRNDRDGASDKDIYDLIITEKKGLKDMKVCHIGLSDIQGIRVVDAKNRKAVRNKRKKMRRFTYNTEFAASKAMEIVAEVDSESYSIFITYDEELFDILSK